jgi:hypothetical protein
MLPWRLAFGAWGFHTTQPSRSCTIRFPYDAFFSECVTWTIVIPSSFNFRNSSIFPRPGSSADFQLAHPPAEVWARQ